MDLGGGRSVLEREELSTCVRQHKAGVAGKRDRRGRLAGAGRSSGRPGARGDGPREGQLIEAEANLLVFDTAPAPSSSTWAGASPRRMRAKTFVAGSGTFGSARGFPIWLADARSENRLAVQKLAACTTWRRCSGPSSIEAWPSRNSCRATGSNREVLHRSAGGPLSGTSAAAKATSILRAVAKEALCWRGAKAAKVRNSRKSVTVGANTSDTGCPRGTLTLTGSSSASAPGSRDAGPDAGSSRVEACHWASPLDRPDIGRWRGRPRRWTPRLQEGGDG